MTKRDIKRKSAVAYVGPPSPKSRPLKKVKTQDNTPSSTSSFPRTRISFSPKTPPNRNQPMEIEESKQSSFVLSLTERSKVYLIKKGRLPSRIARP